MNSVITLIGSMESSRKVILPNVWKCWIQNLWIYTIQNPMLLQMNLMCIFIMTQLNFSQRVYTGFTPMTKKNSKRYVRACAKA